MRVAAAYVVVAWLLIQVTETIFPLFGFDDTPARIVVIVLAIGFMPAMIFAWAFELTPEGLKKESEVDRTQSITPNTGKKLDRMIMVVLALALGYFAFDKFVLDPQREASMEAQKITEVEQARQEGRTEGRVESYGDKSIAVLPFVNMSSDVEQEYFSDGISEELLNLLAKIPELRVISRSSAFSFKGKDIDIPTIAEQLNVAHILEGSVRKAGNQVRITAQLIEARSDTHLWSETYDRRLDDIFAIQDEIAATVVKKLEVTLLGTPPVVEKTDPAAYALVLQGGHFIDKGTSEGLEQAINALNQALEIAPDYARAWTLLAAAYHSQVYHGQLSIQDSKKLAFEAINNALRINPEYAPAHEQLGFMAIYYDNDLSAAAQHFQRAINLDSSNISFAATFMFHLGRLDEAITIQEENVLRDPIYARGHYNLGTFYGDSGYLDKALTSFHTAVKLSPEYRGAHFRIGLMLLLMNQPQAALAAMSKEKEEINHLKGMALALHDLGQKTEFETVFRKLRDDWGDEWPSEIAVVYAWIGDKNTAFEWLEKEIEVNGTYGWTQIPQDLEYQNLHDDPRWQELLTRVGVSAKQLASIEFKVDLPK